MDDRASKGGKARAAKLTTEQRSDIARKAVRARWEKWRADGRPERPRIVGSTRLVIVTTITTCTIPWHTIMAMCVPIVDKRQDMREYQRERRRRLRAAEARAGEGEDA